MESSFTKGAGTEKSSPTVVQESHKPVLVGKLITEPKETIQQNVGEISQKSELSSPTLRNKTPPNRDSGLI